MRPTDQEAIATGKDRLLQADPKKKGHTTSHGATQEAPGQSGDRRRGAEMRARAFIVVSVERNRHGRGTGPRFG